MTDADRARFATIALALATATRSDCDEPTLHLYFRALRDVPINLLSQAADELGATAKFFPKPVEWREAVDEILDRRERQKALAPAGSQLQLPGEIAEFRCEACGNTGWVTSDEPCDRGQRCGRHKESGHSHPIARRCEEKYCLEARKQAVESKRRYARSR